MTLSSPLAEIITLCITAREPDTITSDSNIQGEGFSLSPFLCPPRSGALLARAGRNFIIPRLYTDRQAKSEKIFAQKFIPKFSHSAIDFNSLIMYN